MPHGLRARRRETDFEKVNTSFYSAVVFFFFSSQREGSFNSIEYERASNESLACTKFWRRETGSG